MAEELARYYITEAEERLDSGRRAVSNRRHATAVFYAQECVEYAAKAVLQSLGIEYPPIHDISGILFRLRKDQRLPMWFRVEVPRLSRVVSRLAVLRIPARYGDQRAGVPPSKLLGARDARRAIADAEHLLKLARRFVEWWFAGREGLQAMEESVKLGIRKGSSKTSDKS